MIDGEIYVDSERPDTVFAYRGESGAFTLHYILATSYDKVKRYGDGTCFGQLILRGHVRQLTMSKKQGLHDYLQKTTITGIRLFYTLLYSDKY